MKKRILVVEDEPSILDNILYSLDTEGFTATGCSTGEAALTFLATESYDLVVMDIGLPDTNGFELFKTIRTRSDIPVIFLTARGEEIDRVAGLEMGADDYVIKPFSPRELSARVRAVLRRATGGTSFISKNDGSQPAPDTPSPIAIDEERIQVTYFGEAVPLSSTEFRLLRVFSQHPGRVWSRSQLMDIAWTDPGASMERTVDAHVKTLRSKLKSVRPEIDPIETHRGMGYALKENW
jgi:two-component system, OmpR family, catabolic regulation response regulator CreB